MAKRRYIMEMWMLKKREENEKKKKDNGEGKESVSILK